MRLALVPLNPLVGALEANSAAIIRAAVEAQQAGAHIVVMPELALCGYPPKDLLLQDGFLNACEAACSRIASSVPRGIVVVFGAPTVRHEDGVRIICNSLIVVDGGDESGAARTYTYDKRLLPTYDVFDEDRYFAPGRKPLVVRIGDVKVGFAICEDLWRGEDAGFASRYVGQDDPVGELIASGAKVILSPSASPFVLGKNDRHRAIVRGHALKHNAVVASVNQFGANDELVFDGHAFVYGPHGALIADGGVFQGGMVLCDVPAIAGAVNAGGGSGASSGLEQNLFDALVLGVRDYLRKTGFKEALIGLSGGIDSALTAAIACAAIGAEHVTGVAMPSAYSSSHSIEDAQELAKNLGLKLLTVGIGEMVETCRVHVDPALVALGQAQLGAKLPDLAEENLQSRLRGVTLMALSNRTGAIVLTTGNKSELAVGYCTLYGDMNGGLAVLSDVSKMWVYKLSRWINAEYARCGFRKPPIPVRSIEKAPSAELRPDQTDQDSLPPYEVLDAIIERYVEKRESRGTIIAAGFDAAVVDRMLRLINLAEYKRKQAAIGLKVTTVAFGSGRRWPIAAGKW